MARVINDFERWVDCALGTPDMSHYEQRSVVQTIFLQDVMSLKSEIGEYDNAVLETSNDLLVLDTRDIVEKSVIDNVYRIVALGCQQFDNCVHERLVETTKHIPEVMKKNTIHCSIYTTQAPYDRPQVDLTSLRLRFLEPCQRLHAIV